MGCASSKTGITSGLGNNGDEKNYHDRFLEERVLGQGEFGQVKLVHDINMRHNPEALPLACKALKKGFTYRDNTIYAPMKSEVLQRECHILKTLAGKRFNLRLEALYESSSTVWVITEYCAGGEMMPYVTNAYPDGIRTEDASRIAYQLLSAIDHCSKHSVIHRDIKVENVMFTTPERGAELRLIDYGSGTIDEDVASSDTKDKTPATDLTRTFDNKDLITHTTFAGSAFYISPEMFARTYTDRTDVWSAGVTLYVLVAGYPADQLQKAFNHLHRAKNRDLRKLPHMPEDMPQSYFELLDDMLTFQHKNRKSAEAVLDCEFVRFYREMSKTQELEGADDIGLSLADVAAAAEDGGGKGSTRNGSTRDGTTKSILIEGSVRRHAEYLEYGKFERAVTTLLATVLDVEDLFRLLAGIDALLDTSVMTENQSAHGSAFDGSVHSVATSVGDSTHRIATLEITNRAKLQIIKIEDLHKILKEMNLKNAAIMLEDLANYSRYQTFAYHVALLRVFATGKEENAKRGRSTVSGRARRQKSAAGRANSVFTRVNDDFDLSEHSGGIPSSVHGGNVWQSIIRQNKPIQRAVSSDHLNLSSHV